MSLFGIELPDDTAICPQCGIKYDIHGWHTCGPRPEATMSELLTAEEKSPLGISELFARKDFTSDEQWELHLERLALAKHQRDLTTLHYENVVILARIKSAQKELVERIEPIIAKLIETISHGDYKNGNTDETGMIDEGEVLQFNYVGELMNQWQNLKQEYGI
jgi:hypothetical protein